MSIILTPRLTRELSTLNTIPLHVRWGIVQKNNIKLNIRISKIITNPPKYIHVYLNIIFYKFHIYNFSSLPVEINNIIYKFLTDYINITTIIKFPNSYPYVQPKWSLYNIKHNIHSPPIDIRHYYSYILHRHNKEYKNDWTPAVSLESDILNLLQKINHPEYIFI